MQEYRNVALINIVQANQYQYHAERRAVFTRDSSTGTNFHTDAFEGMMKVSREEAERLKRGESVAGVSKRRLRMSSAAASDEIYAEIYRSFEYFRAA